MQDSSSNWQDSKGRTTLYYNPVSKIRALIQNLDAELMQLCHQCSVSRPTPSLSKQSSSTEASNSQQRIERSAALRQSATMSNQVDSSIPNGIQLRALSNMYRSRVIDAYRSRRIFTVYGHYHTIRRQLLRRGWLEKLAPGRYPKLQGLSEEALLTNVKRGNDYEAVLISRIIHHFPSFFYWQGKGMRDLDCDVYPYRNRVRRSRNLDFTTKVGLIGCAEQSQWFHQEGLSAMSYPRFYRLGGHYEDRMAFIEDFRRTQARSLLHCVLQKLNTPEQILDEHMGTVSASILGFALTSIRKQLAEWDHEEIDEGVKKNEDGEIGDWTTFLVNSSLILNGTGKFNGTLTQLMEYLKFAKPLLDKIEERRPDYKWDGVRNLWILKPGYQCRGIGITIKCTLDDILLWATNNANRRYIAQKYIERPLLIYKTKFDIRQYMLLVIGATLATLWMYKDCYLRFSSQEFSIEDLRESIHLTNNSVQKRYKNKAGRDMRLPKNNMWSLEQFKVYLRQQNAPDNTWDKIYAGLTANLRAVVMASMEETEFVENAFELYGCDFMLDENYNPILIEINSTPDLTPSTEVTARICPNALKDVIKVVVDLPKNPNASTGMFEKVFEINYRQRGKIEPANGLDVCGKTMTLFKPLTSHRHKFWKKTFKYVKKEIALPHIADKKEDKTKPAKGNESKAKSSDKPHTKSNINTIQKEALALKYTIPK